MKLATWNVNSLSVRLPQVLDWLSANPVDLLALQEIKMTDEKFVTQSAKTRSAAQTLADQGFDSYCFGQATYNGVAFIVPKDAPCYAIERNMPSFVDPQARVMAASVGEVRVVNVYVPNGQEVGSSKYTYKLQWLAALHAWLRLELGRFPKLVLMGDFNITFDDQDCYDGAITHEQILCSTQERQALQALGELGLIDAFRLCHPDKREFSWWDYRQNAFARKRGFRIDHILVSPALAPAVRACHIDPAPRANERPSDHAPVVLELGGLRSFLV